MCAFTNNIDLTNDNMLIVKVVVFTQNYKKNTFNTFHKFWINYFTDSIEPIVEIGPPPYVLTFHDSVLYLILPSIYWYFMIYTCDGINYGP